MDGLRFPMFVDLRGRRAVVIGCGAIGARRIRVLLSFGAQVRAVDPLTSPPEGAEWVKRPYERGDVEGAFLCVAATDDRAVNHAVCEEARSLGVPVSVADDRDECDFYFPGIAREGSLIAGVCASGQNHRLAREAAEGIRRLFQAEFKEHSACLQEDKGSTDGR